MQPRFRIFFNTISSEMLPTKNKLNMFYSNIHMYKFYTMNSPIFSTPKSKNSLKIQPKPHKIHYCGDRKCDGECGTLVCGCIDVCRCHSGDCY